MSVNSFRSQSYVPSYVWPKAALCQTSCVSCMPVARSGVKSSQVKCTRITYAPPLPSSSRPASVKGQHATRPIAEFDARPLSVEGQTARWGREASPAQRDGPSRQLSPLDRSNDGRARRKPRDWSTIQQIHSDLRSASKITCAESRVCQASERVHSRPPLRPTKIKFCVAAISVRTNSARSSCSRHPSEPRSYSSAQSLGVRANAVAP